MLETRSPDQKEAHVKSMYIITDRTLYRVADDEQGCGCEVKGSCASCNNSASVPHSVWHSAQAGPQPSICCLRPDEYKAHGVTLTGLAGTDMANMGGTKRSPNHSTFIITKDAAEASACQQLLEEQKKKMASTPLSVPMGVMPMGVMPMAAAQEAMMTTVPDGVAPGGQFQIATPSGLQMMVTCPPNNKAGDTIQIMVPAAPAPVVVAATPVPVVQPMSIERDPTEKV